MHPSRPAWTTLPGPGEIAVSPRLAELLDDTDPAVLADRFPGRVTATVGRDALASPEDLVVFVGHAPDELRAQPGVDAVRSIESAPVSRNLTRTMRIVFAVGGVGLLAPVVVFVATATRLAAARREQRLAALRLAGATTGQVGVVAAVEAALAALGGVAVGFALFFALRPRLARVPVDGASFYPSDLRLSIGWAVTVASAVLALAVGAAIVSLRRVRISPLGVARRARRSRASARPLLLVAAGLAGLAGAVVWDNRSTTGETAIALVIGVMFLLMIAGIVLSGPWLTSLVAGAVARAGRRAPSLLAARRLEDNPSAAFRAISGIVIAVFVGTVFSGIAASILSNDVLLDRGLAPDVVAASTREDIPPEDAGQAPPTRPPRSLRPTSRRWSPSSGPSPVSARSSRCTPCPTIPELRDALARTPEGLHPTTTLALCDDAAALGFDACEGTTLRERQRLRGHRGLGLGADPRGRAGLAAGDGAGRGTTDGRTATMEQARTVLESGIAGRGRSPGRTWRPSPRRRCAPRSGSPTWRWRSRSSSRGAAWRSPWPVRSSSAGTPSPSCAWPGPGCPSCAGW